MQIGRARRTDEKDEGAIVLGYRAAKVRPLDHLTWDERTAVGWLQKGGFWPDAIREGSPMFGVNSDAYRYQVWLFDHAPES